MEHALVAGEVGVQAVAELVGQRGDVAGPAGPVEQHVGVVRRDGVGAERAGPLARSDRGVDPPLVEEPAGDVGQLGREAGVGVEHELLGLAPADRALVVGHRRHAVVVGEPVDAEHLRLERVPALGDVVAADDRVDQRLHRLVAGLVRQVP